MSDLTCVNRSAIRTTYMGGVSRHAKTLSEKNGEMSNSEQTLRMHNRIMQSI